MKIVVAIDSLKGSMSSLKAGEAIKEGIHNVDKNIEVVVKPVADGGEGTYEALLDALHAKEVTVKVSGPLNEEVNAHYGIINNLAIIEMAQAAGITLIPQESFNPMLTTTYGVGEMMKDAYHKGCRRFIVGLGGSITNDGGVGMLQALGYRFLNKEGKEIPRGGGYLSDIVSIDTGSALTLDDCEILVACDVSNPLCGPNGASHIYGPQKGATPDMIELLDQGLNHYASLTKEIYPHSNPNHPGSGAAGGLGFALMSYLNAQMYKGIDLVLKETKLEEDIKDASLVITGEGRLDGQSINGKTPIGVASLAKKYDIPVIAFAGSIASDAKSCHEHGIDAYFPIVRGVTTLQEAMTPTNAYNNMVESVEEVLRVYLIK